MQKYRLSRTEGVMIPVGFPSATDDVCHYGEWVPARDAEAYAEEKRKEGIREGRRDGQAYLIEHEMSVREAVAREREECAKVVVDTAYQILTDRKHLFRAAERIRSRGAAPKCCTCEERGIGKPRWDRLCAIHGEPKPKLEKFRETHNREEREKINEIIDAIRELQGRA